MTTEAPSAPALIAIVLGPTSPAPRAHSLECEAAGSFTPGRPGEPGDWTGHVTDLTTLTIRWPHLTLHPCLAQAARDYGIPAGLQHDDPRGRCLRADVLVGRVLDTDAPVTAAVARVRRLVHVHAAAPFVRTAYARLERAVNALADQLGHGRVDVSHAIHTLRDRPEAITW
ncbi:hypothetical protein ACWCSD_42320 [Nonomuraea sp. NPDC001684]